MKKFLATALIGCLISPFFISYSWYFLQKQNLRREIRQSIAVGLDRNDLIHFIFTPDQAHALLRWERDDEFEFKGQMYDVAESLLKDGLVHYWCIHDHRESEMNRHLKRMVSDALGNHPLNREAQQRISALFKNLFLDNHFAWRPMYSAINADPGFFYLFLLSLPEPRPAIPPPRTT